MELNIGMKISNFTVTNLRPIPDQDAVLVEMVYEKTGTELAWVKSNEPNKLFSIAFKTIPEDSTGVFHILEHSVLCGSDKYPVKEPFVELLKSSMNTFLNAMTFPDKTLYPVSSRNEQDFLNLTSVYLDAVFAPTIRHEPNIYRQEGWHYELDGEQNLTYNGVVFNEMKGAMSSVHRLANSGITNLMYPDNCYQYNSGGDPAVIPNLSYQQFLETYQRCYHPTNARIFLDGNIPVEKTFALLDEYLSRYEMGEKQVLLPQTPVSREKTVTYEAVNDGSPKAWFVMGKILDSFDDKTKTLARQVLCDVLCGSNDAPLKRAVLETGLCQDMTLGIDDGLIQTGMVLTLQNMEDENAPKLEQVIRDCAKTLVENGIPKEKLTASINALSFQVRKMQEPQGLIRCMNALNSWLYGGDPMLYLHYNDSIAELRSMVETDAFEQLLKEMLVEEAGLCKLHVLPSENHGAQLRQAESDRLAAEKAAMTEEEVQQIADTFTAFTAWQQKPDTEEALASLPKLALSEINPEPVLMATQEDACQGVTVLRHKANCNGIVNINGYFRLTDRSLEELTQLSLLGKLLGSLPTAAHTADQLQNEVKTWLGDLGFGIDCVSKMGDNEQCTPMLTFHCSVLQENLHKAEELIYEILTATDFSQHDRIKEILLQTETEQQQRGMMAGHMLAFKAALAQFSAGSAVQEATSGITYTQWLHSLSKNFDAQIGAFTALVNSSLSAAVCRSRLVLGITEEGHTNPAAFLAMLPQGEAAPEKAPYQTKLPKKLGIRIPAQVSYAATGFHLSQLGKQYDGSARLLSNILSLAHLWNEIRVQGGAYGAGMRMSMSGAMFSYSYRDPSPARSLEVYRNMGNFVRKFAQSGEDITGFIISSVAETEPLASPDQLGAGADRDWFSGFSLAQAKEERQQMLRSTAADLEQWCEVLDALREQGSVCVVGYADALAACESENLTVIDI